MIPEEDNGATPREVPRAWEEVPLADCASLTMGQSPKGNAYNTTGDGLPLLNGPTEFGVRFPKPVQFTREVTRTAKPGDILFCVRGNTVGRMNHTNAEVCIGRGLAAIRGVPSVSTTSYLFFFLRFKEPELLAFATAGGSTFPNISKSDLEAIPVPLPPPPEQEKIAAVLWKIQRAIEVEEEIVATARELKQSAMRQLFTRGLRGESQKETEIGLVPQSWGTIPLGQHLNTAQYGLSIRGQPAGRYPILRMNCQHDGQVLFRDLQYVDLDDRAFAAFRIQDGDLLFNRTNSFELVGRTAIFRSKTQAVFASYLIRLTLDQNHLHPEFINYYFNQPSVQADLKRLASRGVSQSNISASKLKEYQIPKAPMHEQREIANILRTIDRKISLHQRKRATLQDLFKTMLHQLMTAQIRVDNLDIDTSEVI